jgi:hypothetical protein
MDVVSHLGWRSITGVAPGDAIKAAARALYRAKSRGCNP